MLTHGNAAPAPPVRVVVMGARGFVGNAIAACLERGRAPVLRLSRLEVDLLAPNGADRLAARLRRDDVLVAVSALAPCRNAAMLRDNMIIAAAMAKAATAAGLRVVVVELATGAVPLHEAPLDGDVCLAVGNEDHGCTASLLAVADAITYIPQSGRVGSLNVAVAAAVAMAEARRRGWAPG